MWYKICCVILFTTVIFAADDGGPNARRNCDPKHKVRWLKPIAGLDIVNTPYERDRKLLHCAQGAQNDAQLRVDRNYVMACVYSGGRPSLARGPTGYMLNSFVRQDDLEVVDCLLKRNADPNTAVEGVDEPALFNANSYRMVKKLFGKGANPSAQNSQGRTPLQQAALDQRPWQVLAALCETGAAVVDVDRLGYTAFHYAFSRGCNADIVNRALVLLACGADENCKDSEGRTVEDRLKKLEQVNEDEMDHIRDLPDVSHARARMANVLARRREIASCYEKVILTQLGKAKVLSQLVMDYFGTPIVPLKDIGLEDKEMGWRGDMAAGVKRAWHWMKVKGGLYDLPND